MKALALDLYNGKVDRIEMSDGKVVDANDALRTLLLEKCGGKLTYRNFRKIENEFYEILETLITVNTSDVSREIFSPIMEFQDVALGDKPEFIVDDGELFKVSLIANGTDNIIRQRVHNKRVDTRAFDLSVATYTDIDAFLLGRIDWKNMVDRVIKSFNKEVVDLIGVTFAKAYDTLSSKDLKVEGAMKRENLVELVEKVGNGAVIYGTKLALSKIPGLQGYSADNDDIRNTGYVKTVNGITCIELENHYDDRAGKFLLPNDTLYVIPSGQKIVYGGFEGDARIVETTEGRVDRQLELFYTRRFHLGMAVASRYGAYKITA